MTLTPAQLARIVKRLPRSADGMPLVPGDKVWLVFRNYLGKWSISGENEVMSVGKARDAWFEYFYRRSAALAEAKRRNKAK